MICPINAGGTRNRQCVGERCAWLVTLKRYFDEDIKACAVSWIACRSVSKCFGDSIEACPHINEYEGGADEG